MEPTLRNVVVLVIAVGLFGLNRIESVPSHALITDLGTLPGDDRSIAGAINDRGQIVGYSTGSVPGEYHPVLWQNGTIIRLMGLDLAFGINNRGQVVGQRTTELGGEPRARVVVWHGGAITELETLPGSFYDFASSINERGEVAGVSLTGSIEDYQYHAVVWRGGAITELGTRPGDTDSGAAAINARGDVAGWSFCRSGDEVHYNPVLWRNGRITELESFPDSAEGASPFGMNNRGEFVGTADVSGAIHAVLWQGESIADLGTLPGDTISVANNINDRGQIVGASFIDPFPRRAVLWSGGKIVQLGTLPGDDTSHAIAINNRGQVVGVSGRRAVVWQIESPGRWDQPRSPLLFTRPGAEPQQ